MPVYCCAYGCSNQQTKEYPGITFHKCCDSYSWLIKNEESMMDSQDHDENLDYTDSKTKCKIKLEPEAVSDHGEVSCDPETKTLSGAEENEKLEDFNMCFIKVETVLCDNESSDDDKSATEVDNLEEEISPEPVKTQCNDVVPKLNVERSSAVDNEFLSYPSKLLAELDEFHTKLKSELDAVVISDVPAKGPFQCDMCKKSYKKKFTLGKHVLIHNEHKSFLCKVCGKGFRHQFGLNQHKQTHVEKNRFTCYVCNKKFKQKVCLSSHMTIHLENKIYSCTHCDKTYRWKSGLNKHMQTHFETKKQVCDICCKSFIWESSLLAHMATHMVQQLSCNLCNRHFKHRDNFELHMRSHAELSSDLT